jgi:transcriptional regulator with XRE-family HTH domain
MAAILDEIKAKGVSVLTISKETGIPANRMYKWYEGKGSPKHEDVQKLRKWLGKDVEEVPREKGESSDLSKLIASNQDLAEANKALAKSHAELVVLMKSSLVQNSDVQIGAVVQTLTDAILKIGEKVEVWDSVEVGRKELNKMVSANLGTKKATRT